MSQYLIIFLIVAVFRGVVWVVQKVQQNAKAREALMAQQANAQLGSSLPGGAAAADAVEHTASGAGPAAARNQAPPPARRSASAAARAQRPMVQRGLAKGADRGSKGSGRGSAAPRTGARPPSPAIAQASALPSGGWASASTSRLEQGGRQGPAQQPASTTGSPASRADLREARVGQSSRDVRRLLLERSSLRQALLVREILGPPRGLEA